MNVVFDEIIEFVPSGGMYLFLRCSVCYQSYSCAGELDIFNRPCENVRVCPWGR